MSRELLQKCLTRMYGHFWADDLCAEIRSALAAPQPEPWKPEWPAFLEYWTHEGHLQTFEDRERFRSAAKAMIAAAPAPADTEGCVACVTCGQPWPAAPVVREPLTDDFIWLLWTRACEKPRLTRDLVCDFARAIEGGGK